MKTKLNLTRADIGDQIILQSDITFVALKASELKGERFTFRIFHAGKMAGAGRVDDTGLVLFNQGEQMPDGVREKVIAMIYEEFPVDMEDEQESDVDPLEGEGRLSLAWIESNSMWRTTK